MIEERQRTLPPPRLPRGGERRVRLAALLVALSIAFGLLIVALAFHSQENVHGVTVAVVAPPIVATSLSDDLGSQVRIRQAGDDHTALQQMDQGGSAAVLLVDLRTTRDTLVIHGAQKPQVAKALTGLMDGQQAHRGRTLSVQTRGFGTTVGDARSLALAAVVAGFFIATALSVGLGPAARSLHHGVRLGAFVALGAFLTVGFTRLGTSATAYLGLALVMSVALTLALEAVFGWVGFAVAASFTLVLVLPGVLVMDPVFLPTWMQNAWAWSPAGAADGAVQSAMVFGSAGLLRHALLLGAWLVVGILVMVLSRWVPHQLDHVASPWRLRITAVAVAFAASLLATIGLAPGPVDAQPTDVPAHFNRLSTCTPIPRVDSVADLNRITRLEGTSDFAGADVGLSVTLQDNRQMWLFADTLREQAGMVRNSILVSDGRCLAAVITSDGGAFIPDRPGSNVGYWPMSVGKISRPGYDLVVTWAQRVRQTGADVFDFETLGPSAVVILVPRGGVPQVIAQQDVGPDTADPGQPMWGSAAAIDGDWMYLYGSANTGGSFGFSVRVARVRFNDILDPNALRFWDGGGWSDRADAAVEVIPADGGTSQTFSVFRQGYVWYALSKQNEFLGSYVRVWTSSAPQGPFTQGPVVALVPSDPVSGQVRYMPLAHPELLPEPGTVVISYSRNDTDLQDILRNPRLYRPHFLRVWLS